MLRSAPLLLPIFLQECAADVKSTVAKAIRSSQGSEYITNVEETRHLAWTPTTTTARESLDVIFPLGAGWENKCFLEGGCATGKVMTKEVVAGWVENDLLGGSDPFPEAGKVPVPWPSEGGPDQLGFRQYVGYSRRQVCYITAKVLLGAGTDGYENGLTRILHTAVPHAETVIPGVNQEGRPTPSAMTGDFGMSLWKLLAACAADPTLEDGAQGPMLVAAKGRGPVDVSEVRNMSKKVALKESKLGICRYNDGDAGPVEAPGLEEMPADVCTPPTIGSAGRDFMTGGYGRVHGQAIQDISAQFLGGYVFGNAVGLGGGQDERLMTYMPEVFVLAFFLSQNHEHPQLRQPSWILGARILMVGLDGPARFNTRLELDTAVPMTSDLLDVKIGGSTYRVGNSAPFLAFMSENQDFLNEGGYWSGLVTAEELHPVLEAARRNSHPEQRAVDEHTWYSFMYQVRAWYGAVALDSYSDDFQPALWAAVKTLGTGPFLAGLWWGDSQLGFLTVWIAHAIAAASWGAAGLPVQYYMYADFTENPGNQCFMHDEEECKRCLDLCTKNPLPTSSFWLPEYAFMGPGQNESCVADSTEFCGQKGFKQVLAAYKDANAGQLWEAVERALEHGPQVQTSVFDLLLA